MRVVNVITRLNIGGASPPVISLTLGLSKLGHESVLVVGTPEPAEGTLVPEARAAGAEVIEIPSLTRDPSPVRDTAALTKLYSFFVRYKPDVVATHMSKAGALGRLAARMAGVPVIVHTYHGKGFQVFDERWKTKMYLALERGLTRLASGSIVVGEQQKREFINWGIDSIDRIEVIRYGLDLIPYQNAANESDRLKAELGVPADVPLVGVVGRVVAIKGQDVFLRAASQLARRRTDVQFVIAGDGDRRAPFENLARELGIADRTHFLGWRRDVPRVLAGLDVVVLPTVLDFEGTPLAVIEALAARRPVVATNVGGVAEVVRDGETGLLVPPKQIDALACAIEAQLNDPSRARRMARAGQELVVRSYQQTRMVHETAAYLSRLLDIGVKKTPAVANQQRVD